MSIVNVNVNAVNSSMNVPNSVVSMLTNLARDVVLSCASRHGFDAEEEMRHLGLDTGVGITLIEKKGKTQGKKDVSSKEEVVGVKSFRGNFPLPYNGTHDESCCSGLKENQFLMTQCQNARKGDDKLCKTCDNQASKNTNGLPKFGTIEMRMACGIFEYVAPNGKSPASYSKVMKKLNLSMEQVQEEASKRGMVLDEGHFAEVVVEAKKSKATTKAVEATIKGKGRPKKAEKVVELVEPTDDLFATLMASAQKTDKSTTDKSTTDKSTTEEQKLISVLTSTEPKKKATKKKVVVEVAKAVVEPVKVVEPVAEVIVEPVAEVIVEPVAEEEEEQESDDEEEQESDDEEVDDVVRIEYKGVKYLKSENTGVIYNMDEDVVGKWNEKTKSIDFEEQEEEEDEYDEEE
jgi:hypothetical protein